MWEVTKRNETLKLGYFLKENLTCDAEPDHHCPALEHSYTSYKIKTVKPIQDQSFRDKTRLYTMDCVYVSIRINMHAMLHIICIS